MAVAIKFPAKPKGVPLGELAANAVSRLRGYWEQVPTRSAALSQKAALQMQFGVTTPPVKMRLERPAGRDKREIKNNFPLNMPRAQAEGIFNRSIYRRYSRDAAHRKIL